MTYFGNLRVNPNPCTEQDQRRNWDIANQLFETIIDQGTVDNYTVCVDTSDTEPAFLNDKLYNQGVYLDGTHQLVYADIYVDAGVRKVRLFTAAAAAAGADNYKVKSSGTDTTDEYLHDAIADAAAGGTYSSGADILVKAETIDAGAGNLRERLFADMSTKTGYSLTVTRVFACVSGNTRFIDLDFLYSEIWTALTLDGLTFDAGTLSIDRINHMIRGKATGPVGAATGSFNIDEVEPLSNGLDPSLGNPATTVTVYNVYNMRWDNNEWVEAAWNPDTSHWETLHKRGTAGQGGTDNLWVCTLSSDIAGATPGTLTSGTGTIYQVDDGGLTDYSTPTNGGPMIVRNPFTCTMPASNAQYPCARTYSDPDDPTLDEWTISGPDMMAVLYALAGAGAAKSLAIPEDGSGAADIQWLGGECPDA